MTFLPGHGCAQVFNLYNLRGTLHTVARHTHRSVHTIELMGLIHTTFCVDVTKSIPMNHLTFFFRRLSCQLLDCAASLGQQQQLRTFVPTTHSEEWVCFVRNKSWWIGFEGHFVHKTVSSFGPVWVHSIHHECYTVPFWFKPKAGQWFYCPNLSTL